MCGVAGYWSKNFINNEIAYKMASSMRHRGPDDLGVSNDKKNGLTLIHTRLSILDLSSAGHQPMRSNCERYIISFNGEIYNHLKIRQKLNSFFNSWKSTTDTETLLIAIKYWGLEKTLREIDGMFAFALWDCKSKTLYLARDRIGEKPMYYGLLNNEFIFSSELKPLKHFPSWEGKIDQESLSLYLKFNYIPSPRSIFKKIKKLPPGNYIVLNENNFNEEIIPKSFWNFYPKKNLNNSSLNKQNISNFKKELLIKIKQSVSSCMISDVPIGSFLSGGFDSTLITSIMQEQNSKPIKTFSVGFSNDKFDEAKYAKEVAQIIHTDHSELYIDSKNVLDVIPKLPDIYSEPFADSSQIPTYLISKFASNNVKVCLSGDGGDELFCGYNRHIQGVKIFEIFSKFPKVIQNKLLYILKLLPFKTWKVAEQILSIKQKNNNLSYHVSKLLNALDKSSDEFSYYLRLISNPNNFDISSNNYYELQKKFQNLDKMLNYREKMMFMDIVQYLPDDILTKVDRASMSNSLEVRAPFLDHKLVEYSLKLPINLKYRENQGKWILKQLVYDYVPKQIMDRPKKGFDVPIESWLRGSLKDWGISLLSEKKLKENNYFNSEEITKMWNEHQSGSNNWQNNLWSILMFQAWKENF